MKKDLRNLTVSYSYNERQGRSVMVPSIKLKGKWLSDIGFRPGQVVRIIVTEKSLTLKIEEPD